MKKRDPSQSLRMKYVFISLILVVAMLLTPVVPAIRLHQVTMLWETMKRAGMPQMNVPTAQAEGPENSTIYLPLVIQAGEADPLGPWSASLRDHQSSKRGNHQRHDVFCRATHRRGDSL